MAKKESSPCLDCCEQFVGWLPVVFLLLIIAWSYYAYVYSLCIILFLIFYHIILIIFLWSFMKCVFTKPGSPSQEFHFTDAEWSQLHSSSSTNGGGNGSRTLTSGQDAIIDEIVQSRQLPVAMVDRDGKYRVCRECESIKPDRAHHCSACGPVNNCIGFRNHKFFAIFLTWGAVYCFYVVGTSAAYFVEFWKNLTDLTVDLYMVMFLFIIGALFGLCQMALAAYHYYLIANNQTTLESLATPRLRNQPPNAKAFDLGCKANMRQVFGSNCFLAALPVYTTLGDGMHWKYRGSLNDHGVAETGHNQSVKQR